MFLAVCLLSRRSAIGSISFVFLTAVWSASSFAKQESQSDFFESRIRPVLVEHCYECHNSSNQAEAELALDWRSGIRTETEHGTSVVPGKSDESLLLKVIKHQVEGLEMPDGGVKLEPGVIADFEKWINQGAHDPRVQPPSSKELEEATSWEATLQARKRWWSFQPIVIPELPESNDWSDHPLDRFIYSRAKVNQLEVSAPAEDAVLARRITFALTGLPPTPEQLSAVESGKLSIESLVDECLGSEHYGERFARHWMDLVRYADSHGSEGDPAIPNAFQYRDYLIRAFNQDVSYRDLVREHIAGDLLAKPRINQELGISESAIGPAHWRLCFHGFAPTDALDEKVRFTDDQINVFGKAFLGLTISCARCHNHKFDAISQADYYALFGVIGSTRPAMRDVTIASQRMKTKLELDAAKKKIKAGLVTAWLKRTRQLRQQFLAGDEAIEGGFEGAMAPTHALFLWNQMRDQMRDHKGDPERWNANWAKLRRRWSEQKTNRDSERRAASDYWDLAKSDDLNAWYGEGFDFFESRRPGEMRIAPSGPTVVSAIYPGGVYSGLLSDRLPGVLGSPRFEVDGKLTAWVRCVGGGQATARYVVQNYPRNGTVYPINELKNRNWHWQRFNLDYWQGDQVHLELATAKDAPVQVRNSDRSWLGVRDVVVRKTEAGTPTDYSMEQWEMILGAAEQAAPKSLVELGDRLCDEFESAIQSWADDEMNDSQALLIDALLRDGVVPNTSQELPLIKGLVLRYREIEKGVPQPFRVPGVVEADSFDQPLMERGDHRRLKQPVPRRFLEAIDPTPYQTQSSGRMELADDLVRVDNPLTSRVIVNRIWLHLFGKGLVDTPDNFGRLGAKPTHPELLDFLAARMIDQGWSIKKMIRFLVLSKAWQQSSQVSPDSARVDPENRWVTHYNSRRLDAESIRDAMMATAGQLDPKMYGPSFSPNSNSRQRAVYVRSQRNNLDQFLAVFDSPVPFATTGKRNTTNVPAQSLTMMNSPFVMELSRNWANAMNTEFPQAADRQKIELMFARGLGRPVKAHELEMFMSYLESTQTLAGSKQRQFDLMSKRREQLVTQLQSIMEPARKQLVAAAGSKAVESASSSVLYRWDFSKGLKDVQSGLALTLKSGAKIEGAALVLDGQGFALSPPIVEKIREKTLEAWVQLDGLGQKGSGIVTLQDLGGNQFDSIVFAELGDRQWLVGSDNHRRTLPFDGLKEESGGAEPVHLAITFATDGTITGYRNGVRYGHPIKKTGAVVFDAGRSRIAIGIRHGTQTSGGRMLRGKVFDVRLHNRALGEDEVAASFAGQPVVSLADVIAHLSDENKDQVSRLKKSIEQTGIELRGLEKIEPSLDPLARVAHAIFNLKEFIYVQ
tara:strand:+ start:132 stop:4223 length:4092 start_codon:yes stop_codon:yes gene_type:complete